MPIYLTLILSIKVADEWINIYDLFSLDKLAIAHEQKKDWWFFDINENQQERLAKYTAQIKTQIEQIRHATVQDPKIK